MSIRASIKLREPASADSLALFNVYRSKSKHEQHGLVALLLEFRREDMLVDRDPAQAGEDRNKLLAVYFESHRRRVEADTDIDFPQLLQRRVVIGHERTVGEAREHEAAAGRKRAAVVRIGDPDLALAFACDGVKSGELGFITFDGLGYAAAHVGADLDAQFGI